METKTNLYVLAKKEVALIFIFMVLVAITSFAFGVKVGKNYTFAMSKVTAEDKQMVDTMLSKTEESVEKVVEEKKEDPARNEMAINNTYDKLKEEFAKLDEKTTTQSETAAVESSRTEAKDDQYAGKFTVQLGSHKSANDAKQFADGFRVRGYSPIIHEVQLPNRGIWFRVSLGVFDSIEMTKEFIIKEKSLFQGMDYVIGRFD